MGNFSAIKMFSGRYSFHILVWLVYGTYILMDSQNYINKNGWLFSIAPILIALLLVAMLVYINAFVLIPKLLERKKIILYISSVLFFVLLNTYLKSLSQQYWDKILWPDEFMPLSSYYKWNLFNSFWSILISTLLLYSQKWSEQRQEVKNTEVARLETELKYLRSQVNPHFLFNGLNTIYGNIDMSNQEARNILLKFSDLLRYNLYEADVDWVELEKENAYLENYVGLQRARSNANLEIELETSIENKGLKVAPLIFIAFVENAFKFSTRNDNTPNYVKISLKQKGSTITFKCSNSFEGTEPETGGIGLKNAARRLELLYRDHHTLNITKGQSVYSVELKFDV